MRRRGSRDDYFRGWVLGASERMNQQDRPPAQVGTGVNFAQGRSDGWEGVDRAVMWSAVNGFNKGYEAAIGSMTCDMFEEIDEWRESM